MAGGASRIRLLDSSTDVVFITAACDVTSERDVEAAVGPAPSAQRARVAQVGSGPTA